jgi:hypothetical protein
MDSGWRDERQCVRHMLNQDLEYQSTEWAIFGTYIGSKELIRGLDIIERESNNEPFPSTMRRLEDGLSTVMGTPRRRRIVDEEHHGRRYSALVR